MASIWKGALAFGLVNIPVELRSAVRSAEKLSFRQLDKKHHQPIKYERVSSVDGKTVPWSDIVKGYEISKGKFVVLDDSDFAAAAVEMSRVLEMTDFVPAESIDPRYFESPYFLVPREGGDKAYALLRDALAETNKVGIGTFALRKKQHLAAVKPMGDALVLELMRFQTELVDPGRDQVPRLGDAEGAAAGARDGRAAHREPRRAVRPGEVPRRVRGQAHEIIKAKAKGKKLAIADAQEPEQTKVVDLVSRLQESLAASAGGKRPRASAKQPAKKRAAKSSRRKSA